MPIYDLYSKQQKRIRGEMPDVFQYENLPQPFRVQVVHILTDVLGTPTYQYGDFVAQLYKGIHDILCREYGIFVLNQHSSEGNFQAALFNYFLQCETERALDIIQLTFRVALGTTDEYRMNSRRTLTPVDAVSELNQRFFEHGIGFQFESGQLIRLDSKLAHSEIVKPALQVLTDKIFAGANAEYLKAHEHFRYGRYKECLNECLKSFESTMKAICEKRHWTYEETDSAKRLIEICFQHNLVPSYLQAHFTSLRASLESGVPTVRNKESGHGQGTEPTDVPYYLASYLLNLTATVILLMADAESGKKATHA